MALSFPLSLADFWDKIPHSPQSEFRLDIPVELNRTAGGGQMAAQIGTALWRGKVTFGAVPYAEWRALGALITRLQSPGASFLATDPKRPTPAFDQAQIGVPQIHSLEGATPTRLLASGFTAGFILNPGDMVGLSTDETPSRHALHEIVHVQQTASGVFALEITPALRFQLKQAQKLHFIKPVCEAIIVPGSVRLGHGRAGVESGLSFEWVQKL